MVLNKKTEKKGEFLKALGKEMAETLYPVPGDIISAGNHYGVYIGHGEVIHLADQAVILSFMADFTKGDPLSIHREANGSMYKPLPAEEIVKRAKAMMGKQKFGAINDSRDFANWCRYTVTAPAVIDASFEISKHMSRLFLHLGWWSAAKDTSVESLDLCDVDAKALLLAQLAEQGRQEKGNKAPDKTGLSLLNSLFGSLDDQEIDPDKVLEESWPILLKELNEDKSYTVSCFLVKKYGVVGKALAVWQAREIKEGLLKLFGNRNMCIIN